MLCEWQLKGIELKWPDIIKQVMKIAKIYTEFGEISKISGVDSLNFQDGKVQAKLDHAYSREHGMEYIEIPYIFFNMDFEKLRSLIKAEIEKRKKKEKAEKLKEKQRRVDENEKKERELFQRLKKKYGEE